MPDEYISIEMTVEETTLSDDAVERLQDKWPTWEPNDADLEVVQIENFASMAAAVADTAASVPSTILQTLGLDLYGVEPGLGDAAVGLLTITFLDAAGGYLVPAGSGFDIDNFAFTTVNDVVSTAGQTTVANVQVQATEDGTDYNDLAGNDVSPISALSYVDSAVLQAPTAGGADADTDEQYMARLLRELSLMGRTLTVLRDYEEFALSHTDVARALALNNGARAVAVFLLGPDGLPVSAARKAALLTEYDDAREVNTATTLWDPAFGVINVTYSVSAYSGYGAVDLIQRCNAKLSDELNSLTWGRPKFIGDIETNLWVNDTVVRRNKLIDALGDVEGVNYVYSLVLSGTNQAGGAALTVSGRPQQDLLTRTATAGQYKLNLDGQITANFLSWDSTGTNIRTALESLSNAEPGDFVISGDAFPLTITYTGAYHGRTRSLALSASSLSGGTITITTPQTAVAGSGDVNLPLANGMVGVPVPGVFTGGVVL